MSYIDTINHSYIGTLEKIPVYHPLENDKEYGLTPHSIVIGGGSGEHAMFIINDINSCVQKYINYINYKNCSNDWLDIFDNYSIRNYWSIKESYDFYKQIKKSLKCFEINSAETYISLCVGEFLLYSGMHLVDDRLIKEKVNLEGPIYFGIAESTMELSSYGKIIVDNKAKFGYSFEDEKRDLKKNK